MARSETEVTNAEAAERIFRAMGVLTHSSLHFEINASKGEMGVLGLLAAVGHSVAPSDMAADLNVSTSRIANTLKSLETKGFVRRETNPEDRRGVIVSITPEGQAFAKSRYIEALKSIVPILDLLGPEDTAELVRIAEKVQDRLAEKEGVLVPPIHHWS